MYERRLMTLFWFVIAAALVSGCAGPKVISTDDRATIRTMAVRVTVPANTLQIFDRVTRRPPVLGSALGALGGLIDAVVIESGAQGEINHSLDGDPKVLDTALGEVQIQYLVDEAFTMLKPTKVHVVAPRELEVQARGNAVDIRQIPRSFYERYHIDAIMDIELAYGLAVFWSDRRPSAAVAGIVVVHRTTDDRVILRKVISSETYSKSGYTIEQFTANGASLYRAELGEASRVFVRLLASEMGEEPPSAERSHWRSYAIPDPERGERTGEVVE